MANAPTSLPPEPTTVVGGYFGGWTINHGYSLRQLVENGSAARLNVLNYAFGRPLPAAPDGPIVPRPRRPGDDYLRSWLPEESIDGVAVGEDAPLRGNYQQLRLLKARFPQLRVLLALGGYRGSIYFSDIALTPESRREFVAATLDVFIRGTLPLQDGAGGEGAAAGVFDGIDVDWEYPAYPCFPGDPASGLPPTKYRPEDTRNFTELMREFRHQMDAIDPGLLLTFAGPAHARKIAKLELAELQQYVNWINVMTYDLNDANVTMTNHHANLYHPQDKPEYVKERSSLDTAIGIYLEAGVPAHKLVAGIPFYGRGWTGVPDENHGLYQPASGPKPATWDMGYEYYGILKGFEGYTRYWDPQAQAPWIYDGTTMWSYEDEQSIALKMDYLRKRGLRGAVAWELAADDAQGTLLAAVSEGLN